MSEAPPSRPRGPGLRVATVSGVPVYVGASWAVIAVAVAVLVGPNLARSRPDLGLLAYGAAMLLAVVLLVSVLVHEAAHAVAARRAGLPVHRVVADLWGGHTVFDAARATPGSSAVVALAGPAANAVLGLVAWAANQAAPPGIPSLLLGGTALVNGSLAAFNLLPGLPLDGGQLVDSLVWKLTGSRNSGLVAAGWCGRVVTVLVLLWFFVRPLVQGAGTISLLWSLLIAGFLWTGATAAIRRGRVGARIDRVGVSDVLVPTLFVPGHELLVPDLAQAIGARPAVVADEAGVAVGYVTAEDLVAVPEAARSSTPLSAVARAQHPGWVVEADPAGPLEPVLEALVETGASLVAVVHQQRLHGVVSARSVNAALGS